MRRVCAICKRVFGCRDEGNVTTCDQCGSRCDFSQKMGAADSEPVHYGVCEACFRQKFVADRPECKG